ncbi:MAG: hypothetical protein GTN74_12270 [Proteobacteria bacterium]|nr:hypothetical protein [Pseudomonadota bacterium]
MNVEVCRRKCQFMEACISYGRYLEAHALEEESSLDMDRHAPTVSPHGGTGEEVQTA